MSDLKLKMFKKHLDVRFHQHETEYGESFSTTPIEIKLLANSDPGIMVAHICSVPPTNFNTIDIWYDLKDIYTNVSGNWEVLTVLAEEFSSTILDIYEDVDPPVSIEIIGAINLNVSTTPTSEYQAYIVFKSGIKKITTAVTWELSSTTNIKITPEAVTGNGVLNIEAVKESCSIKILAHLHISKVIYSGKLDVSISTLTDAIPPLSIKFLSITGKAIALPGEKITYKAVLVTRKASTTSEVEDFLPIEEDVTSLVSWTTSIESCVIDSTSSVIAPVVETSRYLKISAELATYTGSYHTYIATSSLTSLEVLGNLTVASASENVYTTSATLANGQVVLDYPVTWTIQYPSIGNINSFGNYASIIVHTDTIQRVVATVAQKEVNDITNYLDITVLKVLIPELIISGDLTTTGGFTVTYSSQLTFGEFDQRDIIWTCDPILGTIDSGNLVAAISDIDVSGLVKAKLMYLDVELYVEKLLQVNTLRIKSVSLDISGYASVLEKTQATYTATLVLSDNTIKLVTPIWTLSNDKHSITLDGLFTASDVELDDVLVLTASYTDSYTTVTDSKDILVTPTLVVWTPSVLEVIGDTTSIELSVHTYTANLHYASNIDTVMTQNNVIVTWSTSTGSILPSGEFTAPTILDSILSTLTAVYTSDDGKTLSDTLDINIVSSIQLSTSLQEAALALTASGPVATVYSPIAVCSTATTNAITITKGKPYSLCTALQILTGSASGTYRKYVYLTTAGAGSVSDVVITPAMGGGRFTTATTIFYENGKTSLCSKTVVITEYKPSFALSTNSSSLSIASAKPNAKYTISFRLDRVGFSSSILNGSGVFSASGAAQTPSISLLDKGYAQLNISIVLTVDGTQYKSSIPWKNLPPVVNGKVDFDNNTYTAVRISNAPNTVVKIYNSINRGTIVSNTISIGANGQCVSKLQEIKPTLTNVGPWLVLVDVDFGYGAKNYLSRTVKAYTRPVITGDYIFRDIYWLNLLSSNDFSITEIVTCVTKLYSKNLLIQSKTKTYVFINDPARNKKDLSFDITTGYGKFRILMVLTFGDGKTLTHDKEIVLLPKYEVLCKYSADKIMVSGGATYGSFKYYQSINYGTIIAGSGTFNSSGVSYIPKLKITAAHGPGPWLLLTDIDFGSGAKNYCTETIYSNNTTPPPYSTPPPTQPPYANNVMCNDTSGNIVVYGKPNTNIKYYQSINNGVIKISSGILNSAGWFAIAKLKITAAHGSGPWLLLTDVDFGSGAKNYCAETVLPPKIGNPINITTTLPPTKTEPPYISLPPQPTTTIAPPSSGIKINCDKDGYTGYTLISGGVPLARYNYTQSINSGTITEYYGTLDAYGTAKIPDLIATPSPNIVTYLQVTHINCMDGIIRTCEKYLSIISSTFPPYTTIAPPYTTLPPPPPPYTTIAPPYTTPPPYSTTIAPPYTTLPPPPPPYTTIAPPYTTPPPYSTTIAPPYSTTIAPPYTTIAPPYSTTIAPPYSTTIAPPYSTTIAPPYSTTLAPPYSTTLAPPYSTTIAPPYSTTIAPPYSTTISPYPNIFCSSPTGTGIVILNGIPNSSYSSVTRIINSSGNQMSSSFLNNVLDGKGNGYISDVIVTAQMGTGNLTAFTIITFANNFTHTCTKSFFI